MNKLAFSTDQTLLIRALNSTRQVYFPSYIGLRLIASQLPPGINSYLQNVLERRLSSGDRWRFRQFQLYKGSNNISGGVELVYRNCLAPSPLTALAESLILSLLASDKSFSISPRVYSYRWPNSPRAGVSYQYFIEGYHQRNIDIAEALKHPDHVAVVTDIKSFYPSANRVFIESALTRTLQKGGDILKPWQDSIQEFFKQLFDASETGIPVGPASSHILGHLALQDFDAELSERYGAKYFRYVDDVVVVCHRKDASSIKLEIQQYLKAHGFTPNEDKTETVDHSTWQQNILTGDVDEANSFRAYSNDLTVYLAFHPKRANELQCMLADKGLSIPIKRLLALSKYPRYRYFLRRTKARGGLSHALGLVFASNQLFVERGLNIKKAYEIRLAGLLDAPVAKTPGTRRWQVQRIRRLVNSLFYLRNFKEWGGAGNVFDITPELVEQRALATSLSSGAVNAILPFYGGGPSAFAELWSEHGPADAVLVPSHKELTRAEVDALITLRAHGILREEALTGLKGSGDFRLLNAMNQQVATCRTQPDLSYEDELESLRLGVPDKSIAALAQSRYALAESTALEALSLLSSEYRS